jgi:hypothetical protein
MIVMVLVMTGVLSAGCKGKDAAADEAKTSAPAKTPKKTKPAPEPEPTVAAAPPPAAPAPAPKTTIRFEEAGEHEDDACTAMGAPGYALRFKGGTYEDMNEVASLRHCSPRYNSPVNRVFCCPPK